METPGDIINCALIKAIKDEKTIRRENGATFPFCWVRLKGLSCCCCGTASCNKHEATNDETECGKVQMVKLA
jgi:hypothetical protein